jgi:hypothetical protein
MVMVYYDVCRRVLDIDIRLVHKGDVRAPPLWRSDIIHRRHTIETLSERGISRQPFVFKMVRCLAYSTSSHKSLSRPALQISKFLSHLVVLANPYLVLGIL